MQSSIKTQKTIAHIDNGAIAFILYAFQNITDIPAYADALPSYLVRRIRITEIKAGIDHISFLPFNVYIGFTKLSKNKPLS